MRILSKLGYGVAWFCIFLLAAELSARFGGFCS